MENKELSAKERKKLEYPPNCQLEVLCEIYRREKLPYLFDSLIKTLPVEIKKENLRMTEDYIGFTLSSRGNYEYIIPESISGISDYFPPSPEDYKFFISISTSKENYQKKFLVVGKKSGWEIKPKLSTSDEKYYWKIFGECYVLEKSNSHVNIFRLKLILDKNDKEQIIGVKIKSEMIDRKSPEIQQNKKLLTTIRNFEKAN